MTKIRKSCQILAVLVIILLGITNIGSSQRIQVWPDSSWWHYSASVLENHPTAHLLGGGLVNVLARGPWITKSWRNTIPKRLAWCGVFQGAWEYFQVQEIKGYPTRYAVWDWEASMIGCVATEGLLKLVGR